MDSTSTTSARQPDPNGTFAAALDFLRDGLTPIALLPHDKKPSVKWKEFQDRAPTEAELRGMFGPDSNVGIILGDVIRIDADGAAGEKLLAELCGELPATVEFTTPSGGRGFLFRRAPGMAIRTTVKKAETIGKHQELRFQARGALTVMPPSINGAGRWQYVPGRAYGEAQIAELPANLAALMRPRDAPKTKPSPASDDIQTALAALGALKASRADGYDAWLHVGMALHSVSQSLLGAWESWSSQSGKFVDGECQKKWRSFAAGDGITLGSLIHWAQDDSPEWRAPRARQPSQARAPASSPEPGTVTEAPGGDRSTGEVILDYLREKYDPTFRRGPNIWAEKVGREVSRAEACAAPTSDIIPALLMATDFPRGETGPKRSAVPNAYRQWAPIAWADLLASLTDEADSPEIADTAAEQFHAAVADVLMSIESFAYKHRNGKEERVEVQRRSLIDWCRLFAKPGPWQSVRSLALWCRLDEAGKLQVAIHQRLFGQIRRGNLGPSTHRRFAQMCQLYGVGIGGRTSNARFVELADAFVVDLIETPCDGRRDDDGDAAFTRVRANSASQLPSQLPSHGGCNDVDEEP
jgi:hypothetical protein